MLAGQVDIGPMTRAGELRTPCVPGTEGASLPANLSGTRTAQVWATLESDPRAVHGSADGESTGILLADAGVKLSGP